MFYPDSLLGRLERHATDIPGGNAFHFLRENGPADTLTFGELAARVRTLAYAIAQVAKPGDRAVLLYPQGLEFIAAFLGCLAAGVIAVPAYPPKRNRKADRLAAIIADCAPVLLLTIDEIRSSIPGEFAGLLSLSTDSIPTGRDPAWGSERIRADATAFLQYTSGSTGSPRGVVVTHGNIATNELQMAASFRHQSVAGCGPTTKISWLPLFHDMGLIGDVLASTYTGFLCVMMAPTSFLQAPLRWLQAISNFAAQIAGHQILRLTCVADLSAKPKRATWT